MKILSKIFGDETTKRLKQVAPIVARINAYESDMQALSLEQMREKTDEFRARLENGETEADILPEAFALVREAAFRVLGLRPYDEQLTGGVILHEKGIAEMKTGEGKTLVATLPVYLNALSGKGVHVVTVNDYLARRDAVWMGEIYATLGLSLGVINQGESFIYDEAHVQKEEEKDETRDETGSFQVVHEYLRPAERKDAYAADVTYGTNNEFGFDYLRDNVAYKKEQLVQREFNYALVDEIDSVLIDEARTPLIISAPGQESDDMYHTFATIAQTLKPEEDYTIDEKLKAIQLTDQGIEKAEKALGVENIYTDKGIKYVHHLETAVRAKALFENDKDYVVRNGEVVIVDEFTGRLQPGRRWSEGLHQAIEAKEGVSVQKESRTVASITFQNYFRQYKKLAGMTGTALTSQEEFHKVYGLDVIPVPTHQPIARDDLNDLIFQTERGKFKAIARKVKELNENGQPVLIGTVSVEKNEMLADFLQKEGVPHQMLNAKHHENEGAVIAQAGQKGRVTVATNMAGRGVDIKLGGNPATDEQYEEVKRLGGLFVLGTERHEARRIDNQLRGRAGRQGDPGATQFFVSLEDTLMRVFASDAIKNMMGRFGIPEDEPIENKMISRSLENAQTKIEGFNFDSRKRVLEYDDVLNRQRQTIYERRKAFLFGRQEQMQAFLDECIALDLDFAQALEQKKEELGEEIFWGAIQRLTLQTIDVLWMEHLDTMDHLRSSVNLRAYGQRDPLIEYKKEGIRLFRQLEESIKIRVIETLPNVHLKENQDASAFAREERNLREVHENARLIGGSSENKGGKQQAVPQAPIRNEEKVGRNELVTITNGTETKEMKFKKAEPLLASGEWKLVERS